MLAPIFVGCTKCIENDIWVPYPCLTLVHLVSKNRAIVLGKSYLHIQEYFLNFVGSFTEFQRRTQNANRIPTNVLAFKRGIEALELPKLVLSS